MTGPDDSPDGSTPQCSPDNSTPQRSPDDATPQCSPDDATPQRSPDETPLLLDVMLGKLATYLRMCGYDAAYALERGVEADEAILELARAEDRLLVSRDEALVHRADEGVLLTSRDVTDQLQGLAEAGFVLELADEPTHCSACNGRLERVDRTEPTPDYAPAPHETDVWRCQDCGQHFWKGSHWDDVAETLCGL